MRAMKDSGIEWIGEIPKEWEICRLKNYALICNGQDYQTVYDEDGEYSVIGSGGIFSRAFKYMYDEPSVLLGRKGTIDNPLYVDSPFWTVDTMYYTKIDNSNNNAKYFYYLCCLIDFGYYQYGSAVPSMTQRDLSSIAFPKLQLTEQNHIADFLDVKCAKIDKTIEQQRVAIEKLKTYKQSVITEAVTKGLNPDTQMKDSGIKWIGDIHSQWEVIRLKFVLSKIVDCPHETPNYGVDEQYFVIRTADQDLGTLRDQEQMYRLSEDEYKNRIRREPLNKDDIVYGREGE